MRLEINLLPEKERQRLYSLAAVRGYRIQSNRVSGTHYVMKLGDFGRCPSRVTRDFPSKKAARFALLEVMLSQTQRVA